MTSDDVRKLKYAAVLTLIGVIANASSKLNMVLIIKAIAVSSIISIPLLVLIKLFNDKLNQLSPGFKRGISMLSIPIGLITWRWLHSISIYYETISMFVLVYMLIAIMFFLKKKHKEKT